jgi:inorganic triphosphatase YgiF
VQTLKGGGGMQAGIHQRDEWETPVDNDSPDLDRFAAAFSDDDQLQHLLKELRDRQDIQAVFSTDFHREAVMLTLPDGTEVEAAIDKGMVRAGTKRKPISELELELKSGNPAAVFDFARRLLAVVPLTIGTISKAERGYMLCASFGKYRRRHCRARPGVFAPDARRHSPVARCAERFRRCGPGSDAGRYRSRVTKGRTNIGRGEKLGCTAA